VQKPRKFVAIALFASLAAGCAREGDIDSTGGIQTIRSACPAVAVPAYTGDMTLFNPPSSRDSRAIDVVANLTDLRSTCADQGDDVVATANFRIDARRADPRGAREVVVPYFVTVVQGGRAVVSKRISRVTLQFADGQPRANATATAYGYVNRAAATLPADIQQKITRKRKAGDTDAALDPMADPEVKAAVARASFEVLIGLQLSQDQLQYNATR
jgi:hypothetical protein